jgi:hypothetical protein
MFINLVDCYGQSFKTIINQDFIADHLLFFSQPNTFSMSPSASTGTLAFSNTTKSWTTARSPDKFPKSPPLPLGWVRLTSTGSAHRRSPTQLDTGNRSNFTNHQMDFSKSKLLE